MAEAELNGASISMIPGHLLLVRPGDRYRLRVQADGSSDISRLLLQTLRRMLDRAVAETPVRVSPSTMSAAPLNLLSKSPSFRIPIFHSNSPQPHVRTASR